MSSIGMNDTIMIAGDFRPIAAYRDDEAEGRGKRVGRRRRGDADHDARDETEGAALETLVALDVHGHELDGRRFSLVQRDGCG